MANTLLIEKESSGNYAFTLTIDTVVQPTVRNMFNYAMSIGNKVNFSKAEGAYLILRQNIDVSDITLDDGTDVFTNLSITDFLEKLEEIGFNDWRKAGGTGGSTTFEELTDTFNFFGKAGQVAVVNDTETALIATDFYNHNNITELADVFDQIIPNKMLATNKTGTRIELRDIPSTPAPFLTSVGSHTHADLATTTTPLVVLPNTPLQITNDSEGATTDLSNTPYGIGVLWDSVNNQFDFSSLSVGDSVMIRVDLDITTSVTNQFNKVYLTMGVGSPSEKTRLIGQEHIKNAGFFEFDEEVNIVISNEDFRDYPTKIYVESDDDATVVVHEIEDIVIRKNINTVEFQEPDYPADEFKFLQKGYGNTSPYPSIEIGDIFCGWTNDGTIRYSEAIYNGGLLNDSDNFTPLVQTLI